eukprot:m.594791 g.594791  ORF g.594791 m.594791 type:complete len:335 (-) comp58034_c1_seq1:63-1067(-)
MKSILSTRFWFHAIEQYIRAARTIQTEPQERMRHEETISLLRERVVSVRTRIAFRCSELSCSSRVMRFGRPVGGERMPVLLANPSRTTVFRDLSQQPVCGLCAQHLPEFRAQSSQSSKGNSLLRALFQQRAHQLVRRREEPGRIEHDEDTQSLWVVVQALFGEHHGGWAAVAHTKALVVCDQHPLLDIGAGSSVVRLHKARCILQRPHQVPQIGLRLKATISLTKARVHDRSVQRVEADHAKIVRERIVDARGAEAFWMLFDAPVDGCRELGKRVREHPVVASRKPTDCSVVEMLADHVLNLALGFSLMERQRAQLLLQLLQHALLLICQPCPF